MLNKIRNNKALKIIGNILQKTMQVLVEYAFLIS